MPEHVGDVGITVLHILHLEKFPSHGTSSFAVINLRGVSTNKTIIYFIAMQTYKEFKIHSVRK
jgi:hypothetical protein